MPGRQAPRARQAPRPFFFARAPVPDVNIRVASFERRASNNMPTTAIPAREAELREEAILLVTRCREMQDLPAANVEAEAFFCKRLSMLEDLSAWTGRPLELYTSLHTFDYLIVREASATNVESFHQLIEGTRVGLAREPFVGTIIAVSPRSEPVRISVYPAAAFGAALAWLAAHAPQDNDGDGEALAIAAKVVAGEPNEGEVGDSHA